MTKPLDGIRVIDFTNSVAGPLSCAILGDMGAEVIKIEEPRARATAVADCPPVEGAPDHPWNRGARFNELNRSKKHVALDVAHPKGRELFHRLAAVSDVMIENFSPNVVTRLGIDYETLRQVQPSIICVSMPAFGKSGPYKDRRSYGPGIDAMSGLSHLTGYADGAPLKPGNFFCDQNAALLTALSVVAALRHRDRTGEGQYIEMPMIEGEMQLLADAYLDYEFNGRIRSRIGNRHTSMAPHGVYRCLGDDKWVAIAVGSDAEWQALCRVIGRQELVYDPKYADVVSRYRHQDELDAMIGEWTQARDHREVMNTLQAAGVRAGAALTNDEMFDDPHIQARGLFEWVRHPEMGLFPHLRLAFKLLGTPAPIERSAPLFGEHNDYVFKRLLGLSDDEVKRLVEEGITSYQPVGAQR